MKRDWVTNYEKVLSGMTVLERQIADRGGLWKFKNGHWWDDGLDAYVLQCANCHHLFLSKRSDKKTCSERCKKARARANLIDGKRKKGDTQMTLADLDRLVKRHGAALAAG